MASPHDLLDALDTYRRARQVLLTSLGSEASNRDPLAEFSERFVAALLDGELASSRVQKGWDLLARGDRVQVRYLANPEGQWVNEHEVNFSGECDRYALVIFEALEPRAVLIFSRPSLAQVCEALGKRHGRQDEILLLTQRNYVQLLSEQDRFRTRGVVIHELPSSLVR